MGTGAGIGLDIGMDMMRGEPNFGFSARHPSVANRTWEFRKAWNPRRTEYDLWVRPHKCKCGLRLCIYVSNLCSTVEKRDLVRVCPVPLCNFPGPSPDLFYSILAQGVLFGNFGKVAHIRVSREASCVGDCARTSATIEYDNEHSAAVLRQQHHEKFE